MFCKDYVHGRSGTRPLSTGDQQYEYHSVIVRPMAVLFDKRRRQLSIVERAITPNPRATQEIDRLTARISAVVVARSVRSRLPRIQSVALYLGYPNNIRVDIEPQLRETENAIRAYRRRTTQRAGLLRRHRLIEKIPGSVLAYTMTAQNHYEGEWSPSHG